MSNGPGIYVQLVELNRRYADLSVGELWWRYFGLGGMNNASQLNELLHGSVDPTAHE